MVKPRARDAQLQVTPRNTSVQCHGMLSCSIPHGHPNTRAHLRAEQSLEQWFCTLWWQVTKQETVPWGQGKSAGRRQQVDGCTHPHAQQLRCFRDGKQEQSRTRQSPHSRTCHRRAGDTPARRCSYRAFNIGGTEFTKTQMSREREKEALCSAARRIAVCPSKR